MNGRRLLRVFVGSPSDVGAERDCVHQVVQELNATLAPANAAHLELLRWETHTIPETGTDTQDAVNRQIGDDYDIFVGILWGRFGTPTPRAASGTAEEFERARDRQSRDQSVHILFYFKTADLPYDVDPQQLLHVRRFRESLRQQDLVREFRTTEAFEQNIRMALTRLALRVHPAPVRESRDRAPQRTGADDDELGLFDLVDQANEAFSTLSELATGFATDITDLGERVESATSEIQALDIQRNPEETRGARRIVNSLAESMNAFASRLEGQLQGYQEASTRGFWAIQMISRIASDFGVSILEPMHSNLAQVRELRRVMVESGQSIQGMRDNVGGLPRLTAPFNRARRRVTEVLSTLSREIAAGASLANEADTLIVEVIQRLEAADD